MSNWDLEAAHKHSSRHREEVMRSTVCGCFYCLKTFAPSAIEDWLDDGQTTKCPKCPVDSVIGDASGYPIEAAFLNAMHLRWFK